MAHRLLESGDDLLIESSDFRLLEEVATTAVAAAAQHAGFGVSAETRRYWESEIERLRITRDDEDLLILF